MVIRRELCWWLKEHHIDACASVMQQSGAGPQVDQGHISQTSYGICDLAL
jgi:hypothetical protein